MAADGVRREIDLEILGEQIERGIQDAHVGLDAGEHDLGSALGTEAVREAGHGATGEAALDTHFPDSYA